MRHVSRHRRRRHQRPVAVEVREEEEHSTVVEAEGSFVRSFAISARGMHTRHLSISALNLDDFEAGGSACRKTNAEGEKKSSAVCLLNTVVVVFAVAALASLGTLIRLAPLQSNSEERISPLPFLAWILRVYRFTAN